MKRVLVCATLLVAGHSFADAAEVGTTGATIVRIEERSFPGVATERFIPATQYLGVDASGLGDGNLSLHLYGWGRYDFADRSASERRSDGELSYGYLRYRFPRADAEIRAGRMFVNEGVAHEQLDGLFTRADLAYGFTAALFGGAPVRLNNDNKGDYIVGGRFAYHRPGLLELGVSGLREKGAASWRYSPVTTPPVATVDADRGLVGADLWLAAGSMTEIDVFTSYNTSTSTMAEQNYRLKIRPATQVTLAAFFTEREFKGYFANTNLPRLFRPDLLDDSTQYGGSATWLVTAPLELVADYRHIRRASLGGTDRFGVEARLGLSAVSSRIGFGYHRYAAPDVSTPALQPSAYSLSFHEIRGWILYDRGKYLLSLDMIGHLYDDSNNPNLNGTSSDLETTASVGYRLLKDVTMSGDVSYGTNALFKNEFKALARVEFAFSVGDKGSRK